MSEEIKVEIDGRTYSATYTLDKKVLSVKTTHGSKSAEVSPSVRQEDLAYKLLADLVRGSERRKGSRL